MSHLENNQNTKSVLFSDLNIKQHQSEDQKSRRGDRACKKQPECPYFGSWRTDTKTAGGGKDWCKKCLKDEKEENQNKKKDINYNNVYDCIGFNCTKTDIRIRNRKDRENETKRQELKLCSDCFKAV